MKKKLLSILLTILMFSLSIGTISAAESEDNDCITFSSSDGFKLKADYTYYNANSGDTYAGGGKTWDGILEYSTNKINWTEWDGKEISASENQTTSTFYLYLRGDKNTKITSEYNWILTPTSTNKISCSGNIETLRGATGDNPAELQMAEGCYMHMFKCCTSLISAPSLPATNLAKNCYEQMFYECTSLISAPALPATTLAESCYKSMFYYCTSLISAPSLPATSLVDNCYQYMFQGCTSLITAPSLPATTLAKNCYEGMFCRCSSLEVTPYLPATTLAESCYGHMFLACVNLTTILELPATTLAKECYIEMFKDCNELDVNTSGNGKEIEIKSNNNPENWGEKMFTNTKSWQISGQGTLKSDNYPFEKTVYIASQQTRTVTYDANVSAVAYEKNSSIYSKTDNNSSYSSQVYALDKVHVIPEYDKRFKTLSVYKTGDQSTSVQVSNNSFIMPDYDVTINATLEDLPATKLTNNTADFSIEYESDYYYSNVSNLLNDSRFKNGIYLYDNSINSYNGGLITIFVKEKTAGGILSRSCDFKTKLEFIDNHYNKNIYILGTTTEASITLTADNSNTDVVYGVGGTLKYNITTENLPDITDAYVFKVYDSSKAEQTSFTTSLSNNVLTVTVPASAAFDTYTIKTSKGRFTGEDVSFTLAKKELTATTIVEDKYFDNSTKAYVTASNLTGIVNNDTVLIDTVSGEYDTKEVGTNKDVTVKYTLTGTDVAKYYINDKVVKAAIKDIDPGESNNIKGASVDPTNIKNVFKTFITYNEGQVDHSTKYPKPTKFEVKVDNNPSGDTYENNIKEILKVAKGKKYQGYQSSVELTYGETQSQSEEIKDTKGLIKIIYDFNYNDRLDIQLFRVHNGVVEELTTTPNSNGEYIEFDKENNKLIVWAKFYSTYAITYNNYVAPFNYKIVETGVDK